LLEHEERGIVAWLGTVFGGRSKELEAYKIRPLCYGGPQDMSREIRGRIELDDPNRIDKSFDENSEAKVPYFSHEHCDEVAQPIRLVPDDCELFPFEPLEFLNLIKGHRMIFWGDSVQRQFFAYITFRLRMYQVEESMRIAGDQTEGDPIDPKHCKLSRTPYNNGLLLPDACFDIQANMFEKTQSCMRYLDGSTALCFVRTSGSVVDERNVPFWNELDENDILFANVGLHLNSRRKFRASMAEFTKLLEYQYMSGKELPLMMWRDTSAQHFGGGEGGNYPRDYKWLRSVPTATFKCTTYPYEEQRDHDWRNSELMDRGFGIDNLRVQIPILRVWNTTALASELHPRILGSTTDRAWQAETGVADCTHFCPTKGGMYEIWATLMQNFVQAAGNLSETLRPQFIREPIGMADWADQGWDDEFGDEY